MRFPLTVGVLVGGVVLAAPIPKEKEKPKKDEDAIQSIWELVTTEANGVTVPAGADTTMRFAFADGKLKLTLVGKPKEQDATYKLDPDATPKAIDIDEGKGRTSLGIYELDGDKLRICLAEGKTPVRPTEFKAAGKRVMVVTFKRVKEDKKEK